MTPVNLSEQWIELELDALANRDLLRNVRPLPDSGGSFVVGGKRILNFCTNDYLGLSHHPRVKEAAAEAVKKYGAGSTASRLVSGTLELHGELEGLLAEDKGYPTALVFGSGFLANIGIVNALIGTEDTVFADRFVHASLIDAVRMSGARLKRFRHNSVGHLKSLLAHTPRSGRHLVVTESVFSMDGDAAPLADLASVAVQHGAMLMVDEAHSCGISHPTADLTDAVNVSMGTLSKGLGSYGGFAACSHLLRQWLINRSRAFIYTTGLPPACAGAAIGALRLLKEDPGMGCRLLARANMFRDRLKEAGLDTGASVTQIVPVMVGSNEHALALAARLRDRCIHCVAIRPPTVPVGTARIRLSVSMAHADRDLEFAAEQIIDAARKEQLI